MERILFGTDTPWYDQKFDREWIEVCGFSHQEKELVFCKNAQQLLKQ